MKSIVSGIRFGVMWILSVFECCDVLLLRNLVLPGIENSNSNFYYLPTAMFQASVQNNIM